MMAFEEEFGIEIPDEQCRRMLTVSAAIAYIQQDVDDPGYG